MGGFTGFPSRGGFFGIRRLNVSFGLGPQGEIVQTAVGTPGASPGRVSAPVLSAESLSFLLAGTKTGPVAVLTPFGFVLAGDVEAFLAKTFPDHPAAKGSVLGASSAPESPCDDSPNPKAKTKEVSPKARKKKEGAALPLLSESSSKPPRTRAACEPGGIRASSSERKPAARSAPKAPSARKKK